MDDKEFGGSGAADVSGSDLPSIPLGGIRFSMRTLSSVTLIK
jgi:hypothetical protein